MGGREPGTVFDVMRYVVGDGVGGGDTGLLFFGHSRWFGRIRQVAVEFVVTRGVDRDVLFYVNVVRRIVVDGNVIGLVGRVFFR